MTQNGLFNDLQNKKITVRLFLFKNYGQQKSYKKIYF